MTLAIGDVAGDLDQLRVLHPDLPSLKLAQV